MLKFKNFHFICDGCDDCIIRFKCFTHRGAIVTEESKDEDDI